MRRGAPLPALLLALVGGLYLVLMASTPASGAVRALVIGIDRYETLTDLDGAVNDARDLAEALEAAGAAPIVTLLNEEASRDSILAAWHRLADEAESGDVLFVTYAGHGGQETVHGSRAAGEADQRDETLLLGGFAESGAGTYERIRDDEIAGLVTRRPDIAVVLVIDACHSGGMTRSVSRLDTLGADRGKVRFSAYKVGQDDLLPPPPPGPRASAAPSATDAGGGAGGMSPGNLAFIGAVQENELVPEKVIEGEPRGALSWSVARALRGDADFDADGTLTRAEMERFVRNAVRSEMDGRQHPLFEFGSGLETRILEGRRGAPTDPAKLTAPLPVIGVSFADLDRAAAETLLTRLIGAELRTKDQADLLVSQAQRVAVTPLGDVVADDLGESQELQAVIDRTRFLAWAKAVGLQQPLRVGIQPGDKRFTEGERLSIEVAAYEKPALAVVNLAPGGIIQFLYPALDGDALLVEPGRGISFETEATAPFGSNAVVAIASAEPLRGLHEELRRLDGTDDIAGLHAAVSAALQNGTFEIGSAQVFTGRGKEQ